MAKPQGQTSVAAPSAPPAAPSMPSAPAPAPAHASANQHRQALAVAVSEAPPGGNPVKELQERQRAAIERATGKSDRAVVDSAAEGPPPPKAKAAGAANSSTPAAVAPAASASASAAQGQPKPPASSEPVATPAAAPPAPEAPKGPRYDVKSMRKWAEENPEEAAEIRKHVFQADEDTTTEWVRIQNKKRKLKGDMATEREKSKAEVAAERAEAQAMRQAADKAVGALAPIADLWEAVRIDPAKPDFDAADAAFKETAGITIDEYMRLRARRGVSAPESAALRAENARLKRQLAAGALAPVVTEGVEVTPKDKQLPAAEAKPEPMAAGKWEDEVPKTHKFRQIVDWETKLDAEMKRYHDPDMDEYSADPEEIATRLLKREIEAMAEDGPPAPPPTKRGKTVVAVPATKSSKSKASSGIPSAAELTPKVSSTETDDKDDDAPPGFSQRTQWAIDRAMKRQRGEL